MTDTLSLGDSSSEFSGFSEVEEMFGSPPQGRGKTASSDRTQEASRKAVGKQLKSVVTKPSGSKKKSGKMTSKEKKSSDPKQLERSSDTPNSDMPSWFSDTRDKNNNGGGFDIS